ncbi:hypothetical protein CHUAL_006868 [Chamberlinius hualienensis]
MTEESVGSCDRFVKVVVEMPSYKRLGEAVSDFCVLNPGSDDQLECAGYRKSLWKRGAPEWGVWWKRSRCSIAFADCLLLRNAEKQYFVKKVVKMDINKFPREFAHLVWSSSNEISGNVDEDAELTLNQSCYFKYFIHQELRYVWDHRLNIYHRISGYDVGTTCSDLFEKFKGFSEEQQKQRLDLYGINSIGVEVKSYHKLLVEEVLNPFYIFQIFSILLWANDDYYYFAACIFCVSIISISVSLYKTRKQSETLHDMVSATNANTVTVLQKTKICEIQSSMLVPGDVIIIPPRGCVMSCDAVLVAGNCIVNESMLTGESVPDTKTPLLFHDNEIYSPTHHKRHTLFCGTKVIQTRYYEGSNVTAVVVRTGYSTTKGELVRAILFPKPIDFKFYRDSVKFIGFLTLIASFGMIYALVIFILRKAQASFVIKRVPNRINVAGKLKLFCFDKTGTLTEDGLDMWGVVPAINGCFNALVMNPSTLPFESSLLAALATCHSLTVIEGQLTGDPLDLKTFESTNWELIEPCGETTLYDRYAPTVVRPISSTANSPSTSQVLLEPQCQYNVHVPTIVRPPGVDVQAGTAITLGEDHMNLFAKGAPEKITSLCVPSSLPENFNDLLHGYTVQGFRVIAVAWKELGKTLTWHHAQKVKRHELEKEFNFLGLVIMQNALKRETTPVIDVLNAAKIRTVMVTGDNMHTAISVARNCRMIGVHEQIIIVNAFPPEGDAPAYFKYQAADRNSGIVYEMDGVGIENNYVSKPVYHHSTDGKSFAVVRQYFPDVLLNLAIRGTIFARMTPDQKTQLIELLQEQEYIVGMCGDGANDCGALKAAHVGISLSETEASVAAPFTSKIPNVECVPEVIKDGRCALVTSFSVFKFMALYSIIQFVSVLILYTFYNDLGDTQFLFIDLVVATAVAVSMGYTAAADRLTNASPHGTLLGPSILSSICLQILLAAAIQILAFMYLQYQPWYIPLEPQPNVKFTPSFDTTIIFCLSSFQYLAVSLTVSKGKPFRKPVYTNLPLLGCVTVLGAVAIILLVCPAWWMETFFQIIHEKNWKDFNFRLSLLLFALAHLILSFLIEFFVETSVFKTITHLISRKKQPKHKYKRLQKEILETTPWP